MEIQEEPLPLLTLSSNNGSLNQQKNYQQQQQLIIKNENDFEVDHQLNNNNQKQKQQQQQNDKITPPPSSTTTTTNRFNSYLNRGSELWTHWTWLGGQGKMSLMRCNYCLINKQLKNAPKCRRHLIKCQKTPELVRKFFERKELEASRVSAFMREIRSKEVKFSTTTSTTSTTSSLSNSTTTTKSPSTATTIQQINRRSSATWKIVPKPTENDLKHLNHKQQQINNGGLINHQHQQQINNGLIKQQQKIIEQTTTNYTTNDLINKTNILMNYSPLINRSIVKTTNDNLNQSSSLLTTTNKTKINGRITNQQQQSTNLDDSINGQQINYNHLLYQLMSMSSASPSSITPTISVSTTMSSLTIPTTSTPTPSSMVSLDQQQQLINNDERYPILSGKLKRKQQQQQHYDYHHQNGQNLLSNGKENNNIINNNNEILFNNYNNKHYHQHQNGNNNNIINNNNTVIINLDDLSPINNNNNNDYKTSPILINGNHHYNNNNKRIKRLNGYDENDHNENVYNENGHNSENDIIDNEQQISSSTSSLTIQDINLLNDELNDLLLSSFISFGIDLNFIKNVYFNKFIKQLINFTKIFYHQNCLKSSTTTFYNLPNIDTLMSNNILNLIRKFDYETTKLFTECDSIIISFDDINNDEQQLNKQQKLNVNLLIKSSNNSSLINLYYKTINYDVKSIKQFKTKQLSKFFNNNGELIDIIDIKQLNNQIDTLFNKIGSDRINAIVLPFNNNKNRYDKCIDILTKYIQSCHSHVVILTNSYKLFNQLLMDLCRLPSINYILNLSILLFQSLNDQNFFNNNDENNHYQIFDKMKNLKKIFSKKHNNNGDNGENFNFIQINIMLCWLLSLRSDIIKLFNSKDNEFIETKLKNQLKNDDNVEKFFDKITVLFKFLQPFINAIYQIEYESMVISDVIHTYFKLKSIIKNGDDNNFFDGINNIVIGQNEDEKLLLKYLINYYLDDENFSIYYYLAYYLDPRYRNEHYRIDENIELTTKVYDQLFFYAKSLGCLINLNNNNGNGNNGNQPNDINNSNNNNNNNNNDNDDDREKLIDSLDEFRNNNKLYGIKLLKFIKSPSKFWKYLLRFPSSSKLAYCASRLLSISTRSLLNNNQNICLNNNNNGDDSCIRSLYNYFINNNNNDNDNDHDYRMAYEKLLPIKLHLLSTINNYNDDNDNVNIETIDDDDDDDFIINANDDDDNLNNCNNNNNISTKLILNNVIKTIDKYQKYVKIFNLNTNDDDDDYIINGDIIENEYNTDNNNDGDNKNTDNNDNDNNEDC